MNILNKTEILKNVTPTWWHVVLIVSVVAIMVMTSIECKTNSDSLLLAIFCIVIFGLIWAGGVKLIVTKEDVPTGRYRYECTIDDDASFVDIAEKYVVVEQRGEIWVLEDKED